MVQDQGRNDRRGSLQDALKYAQVGTMLVAPMLAFGGIGYYLDGRFGTQPWLLIAGLFAGMAGGFVSFFRLVLPAKSQGPGPRDGDR